MSVLIVTLLAFILLADLSSASENPIPPLLDNKLQGPFLDYLYDFLGANKERPFTPEDSSSIAKISGEYRMSFGYQWADTNDFHWKYADSEINGYNFRYLWGEKRHNTFNPNIYNSFNLIVDLEPPANWSAHMDLIIDPWSFVGETEKITIVGSWGSTVVLQLPYWSNMGRTKAVTLRTSLGDTINIPAMQVKDGDTKPDSRIASGWGEVFSVPALHINREFKPIRNLWFNHNTEMWNLRIFPYAEQAHAMTSDDPLELSGHHIYWEPNPWISYWTPSTEYGTGREAGFWTADSAEGRFGERLRLLRGVSLKIDYDTTNIETMVASSLSPWNHYENINNIAFAARSKTKLTDTVMLGAVYTGRTGMTDSHLESFEQAHGIDASVSFSPELTVAAELARSYSGIDINKGSATRLHGAAAAMRLTYDKAFDIGNTKYKLAFTHMGNNFNPPLATYTSTRNNQSWSDHVEFRELTMDDQKTKIGDGIDRNRNTFSMRNKTSLFDDRFEFLTDYRKIYSSKKVKFLQEIFRSETTLELSKFVTGKTLVLSRRRHPGEDQEHAWIFGGGAECKLNDQITLQGIYERANEYPYWPQASASWLSVDPEPPFPYFNMYKFNAIFEPYKDLAFEYEHCRNGFKYATSLWDNLNRDSVEVRWMPVEKLSVRVVYMHSKTIDLNHLISTNEEDFREHDNIYAEFNWEIWKDKLLNVRFGDLGEFVTTFKTDPDSYADRVSIQPAVLDTQDIIRVTFTGIF